jgi:alpha-ribazole phosphatase
MTAVLPSILDAIGLEPGITRLWLIRHALVEENARALLYGVRDVPLCPDSLQAQVPMYKALAARLPPGAPWVVTPLSRTRRTADAINRWRDDAPEYAVEAELLEQDLGDWQGLRHAELPQHLTEPAPAFWPLAANESPPGGESFARVCARVGRAVERLADRHDGQDVIVVSHGGAIRAAIAHALGLTPTAALHLSVQNLSVSVIERHPAGWRVVSVNELPGV